MPDYEANWILSDPVIPFGIVAVSVDTGNTKTGDGVKKWSVLSYTSGSIGNKDTDNSRSPVDDETVYFSDSLDKWTYRLQGAIDTTTNWESNTTVYPKFALLIEVNDSTNAPTGRFKVGDGSTAYQSLPWSGSDIDLTTFPTGYSIKFNGTYFEAKQFLEVNELPVSLTPTGTMFACDTGEWATPGTGYIDSIPVATNNNLVAFDGTDGKTVKDSGIDYTTLITGDGTPNESFQIHAGVKLFDVNGELHIKSALDAYSNVRVESIYGEFGTFDAINIGGFSTEPNSVTLTSDGTYIYVDGGKLIDVNHDGHGSSLDADTLDTYHASYFASVDHTHTGTYIRYLGEFATYPTSFATGDNYYDTSDSKVKMYINSSVGWINIS
jgi:hypothetical protein